MEAQSLVAYLESPEFAKASTNATRLVSKLKSAIQRKELYETHQIIRTIYFRFINTREKVPPLKELLYLGSIYLLDSHEHISGQDIASLFLEAAAKCLQFRRDEDEVRARRNLADPSYSYHSSANTLDHDICLKVASITVRLPDTEIGQSKFIAEAMKVLNPKLLNLDLFHSVLAKKFWECNDSASSRYHYLHCANLDNAHDIATLLVEYHCDSASRTEVDLFITQFILQLLCLQHPLDPPRLPNQKPTPVNPPNSAVSQKTRASIKCIAARIFSTYTHKHPLISQPFIPFPSLPLLNFTYFIISILDGNQEANTFRVLCDIYKSTWSRDPNYKNYVTRIGTLYFGIVDPAKQRQGGGNGFFNNIMNALLDGADDDDEDSNHETNNLSSCDELD